MVLHSLTSNCDFRFFVGIDGLLFWEPRLHDSPRITRRHSAAVFFAPFVEGRTAEKTSGVTALSVKKWWVEPLKVEDNNQEKHGD